MPSEMTTAEMVERIRKYHSSSEAIGPHEYDSQMLAIADRLAALDKVAKAADRLKYGKLGESGEYWVSSVADVDRLHAALKEAGYGQ